MKYTYIYSLTCLGFLSVATSCSDFLNKEPLTEPNNETYLRGEAQVRSYIDGLYTSLPVQPKFGMGLRGEDKHSDNILAEVYSKRLNGENTDFSAGQEWEKTYQHLRSVNFFLHYYNIAPELETDETRSLKGEAYFFRAYWHFELLRQFGHVPLMDAFWDSNASVAGLQIPQADRADVAKFILSDLERAEGLLLGRAKYQGLRINKETAMLLAMRVALYEGTWEKYHQGTAFASRKGEPNFFFEQVLSWGDKLMATGISLNTSEVGAKPKEEGDAYGQLFNQQDYSQVREAIFWKKYSKAEGVFHALTGLLAGGIIDELGPAGVSGDLVDTYLEANGTPIDPSSDRFKDFNQSFENRDPRLKQTVMSSGAAFKSTATSRPLNVAIWNEASQASVNPPFLAGDGNAHNITGYHIRLGVDPKYVSGESETALILFRYAEALLSYAEAAEELGRCDDAVLDKTLRPLRERAGVTYVKPTSLDPHFTDYGYSLSPIMQEIRRERRVELALQGHRLDDLMRWAGAKVLVGKRGKGAYLGRESVLYRSFNAEQKRKVDKLPLTPQGWLDPLQEILPSGYGFIVGRDYLLPIPPTELRLNKTLEPNPGWIGVNASN